jgi:hypothetical protein
MSYVITPLEDINQVYLAHFVETNVGVFWHLDGEATLHKTNFVAYNSYYDYSSFFERNGYKLIAKVI